MKSSLLFVCMGLLVTACGLAPPQAPDPVPQSAPEAAASLDQGGMRAMRRVVLALAISESLQPGLLGNLTVDQSDAVQAELQRVDGLLSAERGVRKKLDGDDPVLESLDVVRDALSGLARCCTVSGAAGDSPANRDCIAQAGRAWSAGHRYYSALGYSSEAGDPEFRAMLPTPHDDPDAGSRRLSNRLGIPWAENAARLAVERPAETTRSDTVAGASARSVPVAERSASANTASSARDGIHVVSGTVSRRDGLEIAVTRDDLWVLGSAASFYCHVNAVELGPVDNGAMARFDVERSSDSRYVVQVKKFGLYDSTLEARARPGDVLACRAGPGFWWGPEARDLRVYAPHLLRVCLVGNPGRSCFIAGHRIPAGVEGVVELPVQVTAESVTRLTFGDDGRTRPLFASAALVPVIVRGDAQDLADYALVQQIELARLHHLRAGAAELAESLRAFGADVSKLATSGCGRSARNLVAAEARWASGMADYAEENVLGGLILELVGSALMTGLEFVICGSASRAEAVGSAAVSVGSAAWSGFANWSDVVDLESATQVARDAVRHTHRVPPEEQFPAAAGPLADQHLLCSLIGTWRCDVSPIDGLPYRYAFEADGTLRQLDGDGEEQALATWIVRDSRVLVRWASGGEEVATCSWRRAELRYEIVAHTDASQVADVSRFVRIDSD